jgi:hypothetical protein
MWCNRNWRIVMREVLKWWGSAWSRLAAFLLSATIFGWMSLSLIRSERHFDRIVRVVNEALAQQAQLRQEQRERADQLKRLEESIRRLNELYTGAADHAARPPAVVAGPA